ncbi:MAG: T9SS type A sorting domain-containing protein [Bacteroidota bacterium]
MKKLLLVFLLNLFQHVAFATCTPVSITTQPQNQNDSILGHAHFTVDVNGTAPYNYYWYVNGVLTDSTINSSLATNTYSTPSLTMADSNNTYYCIITNCAGANTVTSNTVHLLCIPVSITVQPLSQTFTAGNVATISFSVTVTGTPPFTYKWYKNGSTLVKTTTDTLGSTSIYSFNANPVVYGMNGWNYHVVVTNCHTGIGSGGGNQATSGNAVITVGCPTIPGPGASSSNSVCGNPISLYSGSVAGATYSWSGNNGFSSTSQNSIDYISNSCGGLVTYSVTTTINGCTSAPSVTNAYYQPIPTITGQPIQHQYICSGDSIYAVVGVIQPCPNPGYYYSNTSPSFITVTPILVGGSIRWFSLVNTGTTSGVVTFVVYPTLGGCTGQPYYYYVTVYPVPQVTLTSPIICTGQTATLVASGANNYIWSAGATPIGTDSAVISPNANTSYTVTGTDINGCVGSTVSTVIVSPAAPNQPTSILGITHVCDGSSTAYGVTNDSTATSYTWSLPPTWSGSSDSCLITATADSLGGVITVIANNGCGSSTPQSINVYGSARPVVTLSPLGTVCENLLPFPLTNGNPPGGTYSGTGENSNIFYPYVAGVGTYYITYTYISGACTVSDSVPITVDLCLNVTSNTEESNGITISPNPFTSETTITFNKEQLNTNIKVIDVTGREIKNLEQTIHNTTHTTIDMRGYAKGVYIVQITDDNKNTTNKKVIIE